MSPVTRIVELLKGLAEQAEEEAESDEALYEKFVCWGKQVISQKEATNQQAKKETAELEQLLADLEAGRVELTTERTDLEKEVVDVTQSIEVATATRDKEKADFENAAAEMEQAIDALKAAMEVLETASSGHESGVLLSMRGGAHMSRQAEASSLSRAVQLGNKFLGKGDALYLRHLLTGEVPEWDWKKLNRKATFKMSYKARSFKIQEVLSKLLETFEDNKEEATRKEADSQAVFDKLMAAKETSKKSAQDAIAKMDKENGERGVSKTDAKAQVEALKTQVENDKKYIERVKGELEYKKKEWAERAKLRYGEIEAISKAIHILANDDARDLFKRSLESQGYSFLQTDRSSRSHKQAAANDIRKLAERVHDPRLLAIADSFGGEHFDEVMKAIDKLVERIQEESKSDLEKKEDCEENRAQETRKAIVAARTVDDHTDEITTLQEAADKAEASIAERKAELKQISKEMAAAERQREEERAAYAQEQADDAEAANTVAAAQDVLSKFYKESGLMSLVQQHKGREPMDVAAGEAPPPPPKTWEDPYAGKTDEATGIVAILSMIHEDILRDGARAEAGEKAAEKAYGEMEAELTQAMTDLEAQILELSGTKTKKEQDRIAEEDSRRSKKEELDMFLASIASAEAGCTYFTVNFPVREKNRQIELDGLLQAKAILKGAGFGAKDESRELEPGDALLQQVHGGHGHSHGNGQSQGGHRHSHGHGHSHRRGHGRGHGHARHAA